MEKADNQSHGDKTNRDIHEENPGPGVLVGDDTAHGRPESRGHNDPQNEDRLYQSLLLFRENLAQSGLRGRQQSRTTRTLHNPPEDDFVQ